MRHAVTGAILAAALATGLWFWRSAKGRTRGEVSREVAMPSRPAQLSDEPEQKAPSDTPRPRREPVLPSEAERTSTELEERVRALEGEVERLRAELATARGDVDFDSAEEIRAALRELNPNDPRTTAERSARRRELLQQLVERFPDDPGAAKALDELSGSWIAVDPARSLEVIERFGTRVGLPTWRQDRLSANALDFCDRVAESDLAYQRIIDSPDAPEDERWRARFFAAYLYMRRGEYDEARARFDALLELAGPDPPASIARTIEGAKEQLELIERYEERR